MSTTLVLLRHGKSDWSVAASDRERPLTLRGIRQAGEAGRWIGRHVELDLAVVSVARRAQQTWDLAGDSLSSPPRRLDSEALYTFEAREVLDVVRDLPESVGTVVLVGHNPAFEEVVGLLTGEWVEMKTASIAVVRMASWTEPDGHLSAHGRPPAPGSVVEV